MQAPAVNDNIVEMYIIALIIMSLCHLFLTSPTAISIVDTNRWRKRIKILISVKQKMIVYLFCDQKSCFRYFSYFRALNLVIYLDNKI